MAGWVLLPTNHTDAVWSGLKKYVLVTNDDNTISLQDVTIYSNIDNSFFGALEANRMNEALNTIMSMLENGTDLYEAFQNYFALQKNLFENSADEKQEDFVDYINALKAEGDLIILGLKTDYQADMNAFKSQQQVVFEVWFQGVRDKLNQDVAGQLINAINDVKQDMFSYYYGLVNKVTNIDKYADGSKIIIETGEGVTATTSFEIIEGGKKITTTVIPDSDIYKYIKTVLIETVPTGKRITETYVTEVK